MNYTTTITSQNLTGLAQDAARRARQRIKRPNKVRPGSILMSRWKGK